MLYNVIRNQSLALFFFISIRILKNNKVLRRRTWSLFRHDQCFYSPDLSEDGSCSQCDKHSLSIRSSDHLHFTCFYDVHLSTHLPLLIEKYGRMWEKKKLESRTLVVPQSAPFCRRNHQAGKRLSEGSSTCQRSSVCHSPVRMVKDKDKSNKDFPIINNLLV